VHHREKGGLMGENRKEITKERERQMGKIGSKSKLPQSKNNKRRR